MDVSPPSDSGIAFPQEFFSALRSCDTSDVILALPRSVKRAFAFLRRIFSSSFQKKKVLAPDTVVIPERPQYKFLSSSPLISRDFTQRV